MNSSIWRRAVGYSLAVTFTVYAVASVLLWTDMGLTLTTRLLSAAAMLALLCIIARLFHGGISGATVVFPLNYNLPLLGGG